MGTPIDITGQTWNGITAIRRLGQNKRGVFIWEFRCHCDKLFVALPCDVRNSKTCSCGCSRFGGVTVDMNREEWLIYQIWVEMRQRCNNSNNPGYHNYGGRGIKVVSMWNTFLTFQQDMGPRPTPQHTLERKNNDGNYSKENCCWATRSENNYNKRPRNSCL